MLTDSNNEELLKLKADLEEVIELTRDLIQTQEGESSISHIHSSSNDDNVAAAVLGTEDADFIENPSLKWRVGEKCLAKWKSDGM